jgi:acetyltransferase-like isoleucine patch superfamily enzyme
MAGYWSHERAMVESESVGDGTRVWAFSHVMKGAVVGRDCNLGEHVFVETGAVIGDRVTVKNGVQVWEGVRIGDDVFVGPNAVFTNDLFPRSPRLEDVREHYRSRAWYRETVVEAGASIGANATILCGVRLGAFCMVGAGSVVTGDVAPFTLVVGSPARPRGHVNRRGEKLERRGRFLVAPGSGSWYRLENGVLHEMPQTRRHRRQAEA